MKGEGQGKEAYSIRVYWLLVGMGGDQEGESEDGNAGGGER